MMVSFRMRCPLWATSVKTIPSMEIPSCQVCSAFVISIHGLILPPQSAKSLEGHHRISWKSPKCVFTCGMLQHVSGFRDPMFSGVRGKTLRLLKFSQRCAQGRSQQRRKKSLSPRHSNPYLLMNPLQVYSRHITCNIRMRRRWGVRTSLCAVPRILALFQQHVHDLLVIEIMGVPRAKLRRQV